MVGEEVVAVSSPVPLDNHKRKIDDLESEATDQSPSASPDKGVEVEEQCPVQDVSDVSEAKRPRIDDSSNEGLADENGYQNGKGDAAEESNPQREVEAVEEDKNVSEEAPNKGIDEIAVEDKEQNLDLHQDAQVTSLKVEQSEDEVKPSENDPQTAAEMPLNLSEVEQSEDEVKPSSEQDLTESGDQTISRRLEVPNNKVGVLIGKAGDTIRNLQHNSGAKIQITRDADADPRAPTRPVELIGTLNSINKAEKLIKEVMAEADAGGSPSLVARGFALAAGVMEQIQIQVPNEKVGLIIGKGGDTIKNLQTRSGARIQLLPQHLADGDKSKERTLRISGDKKQIDMAMELIKEAMNQNVKQSTPSSNYGQQQAYRPRGPPGGFPQWGPHAPRNTQPTPYDYQQQRGGPYSSQTQQYPPYGGYPSQGPQRGGGYGSGWEQRPPMQGPHNPSGGYNYYGGQGGPQSAPHPTHMPSGPSNIPPHPQANYNYGQPPYSQSQTMPPPQQGYNQTAPQQQPYGAPHGSSQPASYQDTQGYPNQQQQYPPQPYSVPSQGAPPAQSYPASQPSYQAPVSGAQYGQAMPAQQPYPYASVPATTNDAYGQPQPAVASMPGYPQQAVTQPVAGYSQPGLQQQAPAYSQAAYAQYPQTQHGYGYQVQADPSAYGAAQTGYAQPTTNQPSYDQSVPQQPGAYPAPASAASAAPVGSQPAPVYPQQ